MKMIDAINAAMDTEQQSGTKIVLQSEIEHDKY